ncbi:hypothetical protein HZS_5270, partial [Henneguya salminicola]
MVLVQMNQHSHGSDAAQLQRNRNESQAAPPQPTDRASIIIPDTYRFYEVIPGRMEEFLLYDFGEQDEARILIFGQQSNSEWSHLIEKLYFDGTFSLEPNFFSQIYGFVLPVLYALLPNKAELIDDYEGLLRRYNTDHDFALAARIIVALSFVPIEDIDVAFEALETEIKEDFLPILNWFEDVYIGRQNRNRTRRSALFPPHMWS